MEQSPSKSYNPPNKVVLPPNRKNVSEITLQDMKEYRIDITDPMYDTQPSQQKNPPSQDDMVNDDDDDSKCFLMRSDLPSDSGSECSSGSDVEAEFTMPVEELPATSKQNAVASVQFNPATKVKTLSYPDGTTVEVDFDVAASFDVLSERLNRKSDVTFVETTPTKGAKRMASNREATPGVKKPAAASRGRTTRSGARYNRLSSGSDASKQTVRDVIKGFKSDNPNSKAFDMVSTPSKGRKIDREATMKNRSAGKENLPELELPPEFVALLTEKDRKCLSMMKKNRLLETLPELGGREEYQKYLDIIRKKDDARREVMKQNRELEEKKKQVAKDKVKERFEMSLRKKLDSQRRKIERLRKTIPYLAANKGKEYLKRAYVREADMELKQEMEEAQRMLDLKEMAKDPSTRHRFEALLSANPPLWVTADQYMYRAGGYLSLTDSISYINCCEMFGELPSPVTTSQFQDYMKKKEHQKQMERKAILQREENELVRQEEEAAIEHLNKKNITLPIAEEYSEEWQSDRKPSAKKAPPAPAPKKLPEPKKDLHTTHLFNFMDFVPDDDYVTDDEVVAISQAEYEKELEAKKTKVVVVKKETAQKQKPSKKKVIKQVAGQRKLKVEKGDDYVGLGSPVGEQIVSGKTGIKQEDLKTYTTAWKALAREVGKFIRELGENEPSLAAMILEGGDTMQAVLAENFLQETTPVKPETDLDEEVV